MSKSSDIGKVSETKTMRQRLSGFFKKLWKMSLRHEDDSSLRDTIEELIGEDEEEGDQSIDDDEKTMLGNVLSLKDLIAEDIMIPYANIVAASITATPNEVMHIFTKSSISQIPIYSGTVDNVIGLLCLKDALLWMNGKTKVTLKSLLKEILYIAPTMRILDLLLQMRESGEKLAIVVDEYGGVAGMVPFAAVIENIVGDIQYEEYNHAKNQIEIQNGIVILNAGMPLEELNDSLEKICSKRINWVQGLEDEDVDTIGGIVTMAAGRVPIQGEIILHPLGIEFEVLESDPRHVKKIAIRKLPELQQITKLKADGIENSHCLDRHAVPYTDSCSRDCSDEQSSFH